MLLVPTPSIEYDAERAISTPLLRSHNGEPEAKEVGAKAIVLHYGYLTIGSVLQTTTNISLEMPDPSLATPTATASTSRISNSKA